MASTGRSEGRAGAETEDDLWLSKAQLDMRLKGRERPILASALAVIVTVFGFFLLLRSFTSTVVPIFNVLLMAVGLATIAAGIGLWQLKAWAWDLTVIVLLMSLISVSTPDFIFSFAGVALLIYLLLVREYFT